jgi:hypothetical protein
LIYLIDKGFHYFNQFKRDRRLSPQNQAERISALSALDMASRMAKRVRSRLEEDPIPPARSEVAEMLRECRANLASASEHLEAVMKTSEGDGEIRIESTFSVGSEDWAAAANQGSPCYHPTSP